jgi:hypothetical protein
MKQQQTLKKQLEISDTCSHAKNNPTAGCHNIFPGISGEFMPGRRIVVHHLSDNHHYNKEVFNNDSKDPARVQNTKDNSSFST